MGNLALPLVTGMEGGAFLAQKDEVATTDGEDEAEAKTSRCVFRSSARAVAASITLLSSTKFMAWTVMLGWIR